MIMKATSLLKINNILMKTYKSVFLALLVLLFSQCKRNELQQYTAKPAVYFSAFSEKDSVVHSLVGSNTINDTVFVKLQLLGNTVNKDLQFKIAVDPAYSTATEGKHYEKLKDSYVLPANTFSSTIPVVLYKTDQELNQKSFKIGLKVIGSEDLDVGYPNKSNAHIIFTNQLVKPAYWDTYLMIYYGAYSKVKHAKAIEIQQFDFPALRTDATPMQSKLMSYGRIVCKYFTDNVVNDENGNRIQPWSPL